MVPGHGHGVVVIVVDAVWTFRGPVHDPLVFHAPEGVVPGELRPEALTDRVIGEDATSTLVGEVERGVGILVVGNHVTDAPAVVDLLGCFGRDLRVENVYGQGREWNEAEHHDDDFGGTNALLCSHDVSFRGWVNIDSLDCRLDDRHLRSSLRHLLRRQGLLVRWRVLLFHPRKPRIFCCDLHESLHPRFAPWCALDHPDPGLERLLSGTLCLGRRENEAHFGRVNVALGAARGTFLPTVLQTNT